MATITIIYSSSSSSAREIAALFMIGMNLSFDFCYVKIKIILSPCGCNKSICKIEKKHLFDFCARVQLIKSQISDLFKFVCDQSGKIKNVKLLILCGISLLN